MKIAFLADLHINTGTYGGSDKDGLNFRTRDFMDAFHWATSKIIEEVKPDIVAILGDIYDNAHPSNNIRRFFNSQIRRFNAAGITVHVLVGNHDACKLNHALEPLEGMGIPNVFVHYSPTIIAPKDKSSPVLFIFPHSQEVERREIGMREFFVKTATEWNSKAKKYEETGRQTVLLGHFPIRGAKLADTASDDREDDISSEDIDILSPTYALFGDFHSAQKLDCKTNAMYVGSLERSSFNDITGKKGFAVYDSAGVSNPFIGSNIEFIEYPNARPMILLKGDWDTIEPQISSLEKTAKDAIVKIHFQGNISQFARFDKEKEKAKKTISSFGAKIVLINSQIEDSNRERAVQKIKEEIQKMDDVEFKDIDQVVQTSLKGNSENPEDSKKVYDIAHDIMKSVKEKKESIDGVSPSGMIRIHGVRGHNFQRFGEKDNIIEFDQGSKYFLGTPLDELPQWQKEDFHRKGKTFLDKCLKQQLRKIISIVGMTDGDPTKSNGSGKSTIIEMIVYALYEKRAREYIHKFVDREKGKSTTSIMREKNGKIDCQEAFVDLLFSVDNSLWLLRRGRRIVGKDSSKHESILEIYCITSDGFAFSEGSHGGHRGEDANKTVSNLIKMSFETFCSSLLFGQNDAGQFLVGTDKTRKEIIINILQLGILNDYLEETRRRKKETENEMVSLRAQAEVLLEGADEKEAEFRSKISSLSMEIEELEKRKSEIGLKISEIDATVFISAYEKAKANVDAKDGEIKSKSKEMEKEISNLRTQIEKCKKDRDEREKSLKQVQKKNEEDRTLLLSSEKIVKEYPHDKIKNQLSLVDSAKKSKPERESQRTKLQASLDKLLPICGELSGAIRERQNELDNLQLLKKKCESGVKVQCSKCRQLVGIGHIDAEISRLSSEISAKKTNLDDVLKDKSKLEKELSEVKTRLENIGKYLDKESEIYAVQHQYESAKTKIEELKSRISTNTDELKTSTESLLRVSEDKAVLDSELENLEKNKQKALTPYENEKKSAEEELKKKKEELDKTKKAISVLEEELKRVTSDIGSKETSKARAEAGVEAIKEARDKAKILSERLESNTKTLGFFKTLDWVFGPDGAQVHIIEKYMPLLNHYFQEFLDIFSDRTIRASVVTDGKREGKVELAIAGELSSVTDGLSGGEGVKLRLPLDMALGMLSLTRANGSIDSIYIDEAIAPVDVDSKERVFELLEKLQEYFRTVVIVSHDQALQERIKDTIVVNKVDGISIVEKQHYESLVEKV